jgi:single-strand DNA-binding protein
VKFFGRLAEIAGEYLKKGRQVYIEGRLRTEKYTDKAGVEKYSTDIIADEMQMLGGNPGMGGEGGGERAERPARSGGGGGYGGGRGAGAAGGSGGGGYGNRGGGSGGGSGGGYGNRSGGSAPPAQSNDPFPDDDIPF